MMRNPTLDRTACTQPDTTSVSSYWRAAVYLSAAQLYLRSNCLLERPLRAEHLKHPVLGHWGTSPGICFFYAHLSDFARRTRRRVAFVVGPGHAAPAVLACTYLDGTLGTTYPELSHGRHGLESLVSGFASPAGFESEISAAIPGMIYGGGELGPALSVAQGFALDAPEFTVACVIGDGEFETGPTACAWQGGKLIDPIYSGAFLPILHLNQFRMGGRSLLSHRTEQELRDFFRGSGYQPLFVGTSHEDMASALTIAHEMLLDISVERRPGPHWPVLIVRTPKGWSGPEHWAGRPIEGGSWSHKTPFRSPANDAEERLALEQWLRSYALNELFDDAGHPHPQVLRCLPPHSLRLAATSSADLATRLHPLPLPPDDLALTKTSQKVAQSSGRQHEMALSRPHAPDRRDQQASSAEAIAEYLARVIRADGSRHRFRVFSPDELHSNRLTAVLEETDLASPKSSAPGELPASRHGRVMEVLSEHLCVGWLQGYLLGARHGIFVTYEGFAPIASSMVTQYLKFVAVARRLPWRSPRASLTFFLTSLCWDNCYTHQNPAFIGTVLSGEFPFVRVYTPSDASAAVAALRDSLCSTDRMNLIVASKSPMPQWFDRTTAQQAVQAGYSTWPTSPPIADSLVDVVLAAVGDRLCLEAMQAMQILSARLPQLGVRLVPVQEVTALGAPGHFEAASSEARFTRHFTSHAPVHLAFTGHPSTLKQLLFDRLSPDRFTVAGFHISSGRTTPFGLLTANEVDRFSLAVRVGRLALTRRPELRRAVDNLARWAQRQTTRHELGNILA